MIRKYHNHIPQTTPWHREEEPLYHQESPGRQTKQSNQFSPPHQDDYNIKVWYSFNIDLLYGSKNGRQSSTWLYRFLIFASIFTFKIEKRLFWTKSEALGGQFYKN